MARQCVGRDAKFLDGPCERESSSMKLGLRHQLFIEVSFAEDQEMAGCVVVGGSVAGNLGASQFVDVAVTVDADVISDVDPPQLVLVVMLILSEAARGITVFPEDHALVVEGQTGYGVEPSSRACRLRAPSISA